MNTKKLYLKKIGNIIFTLLIVILVGLIALSIYAKNTNQAIFTYTVLWVKTDSMEDTIPAESYILVKKTDAKDVKVGDVITFTSNDPELNGDYNTHRVVWINETHTKFITRGDKYEENDDYPVYSTDIFYKYVGNLGFLTFLARLFQTPFGLIAISIAFAVAVGYNVIYLSKAVKETKETKKQKEIDRLVALEVERLKAENNGEREKTIDN